MHSKSDKNERDVGRWAVQWKKCSFGHNNTEKCEKEHIKIIITKVTGRRLRRRYFGAYKCPIYILNPDQEEDNFIMLNIYTSRLQTHLKIIHLWGSKNWHSMLSLLQYHLAHIQSFPWMNCVFNLKLVVSSTNIVITRTR